MFPSISVTFLKAETVSNLFTVSDLKPNIVGNKYLSPLDTENVGKSEEASYTMYSFQNPVLL